MANSLYSDDSTVGGGAPRRLSAVTDSVDDPQAQHPGHLGRR